MIQNKSIIDKAACIVDTDSDAKQITLDGWAVEALQSGNIRKLSKGVIAYECLHMSHEDYSDSFSKIEEQANRQADVDIFGLIDDMVNKNQTQAAES